MLINFSKKSSEKTIFTAKWNSGVARQQFVDSIHISHPGDKCSKAQTHILLISGFIQYQQHLFIFISQIVFFFSEENRGK